MYKNIAIAVLCLGFIVGCGDKESPTVMAKPEVGQAKDNSADQPKSETALFLPGGAGIDFGVKPVFDKVQEDTPGNKFRYVIYDLPDAVAAVDGALNKILLSKGYEVAYLSPVPADYQQWATYSKQGSPDILIRYKKYVMEGFTTGAKVIFKWRQ